MTNIPIKPPFLVRILAARYITRVQSTEIRKISVRWEKPRKNIHGCLWTCNLLRWMHSKLPLNHRPARSTHTDPQTFECGSWNQNSSNSSKFVQHLNRQLIELWLVSVQVHFMTFWHRLCWIISLPLLLRIECAIYVKLVLRSLICT